MQVSLIDFKKLSEWELDKEDIIKPLEFPEPNNLINLEEEEIHEIESIPDQIETFSEMPKFATEQQQWEKHKSNS